MVDFETGRRVSEVLSNEKDLTMEAATRLIVSAVSDISSADRQLVRLLRDASQDGILRLLIQANSRAGLIAAKDTLLQEAFRLYSQDLLSRYEQFLEGFIAEKLRHLPSNGHSNAATSPVAPSALWSGAASQPSSQPVPMAAPGSGASQPPSTPGAPESLGSGAGLRPAEGGRRGRLLAAAAAGVFGIAGIAIGALGNRSLQNSPVPIAADSGATSSGDSYDRILMNGTMRVGAQAESPPMNHVDNGQRTGLDFEILKLMARQREFGLTREGSVQGEVNVDDYSAVPDLLDKRDNRGTYAVDVVAGGLTFKDGDTPGVRYTIPYMDGFGYALIVPKGSPLTTVKSLEGKRIGLIQGDPDVEAYAKRTFPQSKLVYLSDGDESWIKDSLIESRSVDAIVYDFPFASVELKGQPLTIAISNLPASNLEYRFGVRSSDEKLLNKLNAAIRRIKTTPEYGRLLRRFLPVDQVLKPERTGRKTYPVAAGDTLSSIATRHLGSAERWIDLQKLNNLPNPNFIEVGQSIVVPDDFR